MDYANRHTCCWGPFRTRIETGTTVMALFGFGLGILSAISSYVGFHNLYAGMVYLASSLFYLSVIVAMKKKEPSLFLPYLIFEGIGLLCAAVISLTMFIFGIWSPQQAFSTKEQEMNFRSLMLFFAATVGIDVALNAWFYSIIYRTYNLLKKTTKMVPSATAAASARVPPPV
ncbi:hypothetical protein niasHT_034172 [Heterodera trifolii]|uniref:Uncharacterized protein n=1 Tax=Heterodera trifolii TaxID=157864 RepID=A0ABD2IA65_9BILA